MKPADTNIIVHEHKTMEDLRAKPKHYSKCHSPGASFKYRQAFDKKIARGRRRMKLAVQRGLCAAYKKRNASPEPSHVVANAAPDRSDALAKYVMAQLPLPGPGDNPPAQARIGQEEKT